MELNDLYGFMQGSYYVVWVIGTIGIAQARVLEKVTSYELFGPVPVSRSFSTEEAATQYLKGKRK